MTSTDFLLVAILFLYLKWILIIISIPYYSIFNWCKQHRTKRNIILGSPIIAIVKTLNLLSRGGWERFMLIQLSTLPSLHIRKWSYIALGAKISHRVIFHYKTELRSPYQLIIGEGTIIGDNALLDARSGLSIGSNVNLSSNVSIYTLQHDYRDPLFRCSKTRNMRVDIGDRVWLGSNVIVLPGVKIGEGAVCCTGCVVTKDIEPYTVVAGIPAKKVGERPKVLEYEFNGKSCRFY